MSELKTFLSDGNDSMLSGFLHAWFEFRNTCCWKLLAVCYIISWCINCLQLHVWEMCENTYSVSLHVIEWNIMVFTCNTIYILLLVNIEFPCGVIRLIEATEACRAQQRAEISCTSVTSVCLETRTHLYFSTKMIKKFWIFRSSLNHLSLRLLNRVQ